MSVLLLLAFMLLAGMTTVVVAGRLSTSSGHSGARAAGASAARIARTAQGLATSTGCQAGYVFRLAVPGDDACVSPADRAAAAGEDLAAVQAQRHPQPPGGVYGIATCSQGYVWREAVPGDTACVTPLRRAEVAQENLDSPTHRSAAS